MSIAERVRRVVLVVIVTVSVLTTAFGAVLGARAPKDCCRALLGGGSCSLEQPYRGCLSDGECNNVDFPTCCDTGLFCK